MKRSAMIGFLAVFNLVVASALYIVWNTVPPFGSVVSAEVARSLALESTRMQTPQYYAAGRPVTSEEIAKHEIEWTFFAVREGAVAGLATAALGPEISAFSKARALFCASLAALIVNFLASFYLVVKAVGEAQAHGKSTGPV